MARTELDTLIGSEPEDVTKKYESGAYKDRAADMPMDEKLPEKALPMKETPKPFKLGGG